MPIHAQCGGGSQRACDHFAELLQINDVTAPIVNPHAVEVAQVARRITVAAVLEDRHVVSAGKEVIGDFVIATIELRKTVGDDDGTLGIGGGFGVAVALREIRVTVRDVAQFAVMGVLRNRQLRESRMRGGRHPALRGACGEGGLHHIGHS